MDGDQVMGIRGKSSAGTSVTEQAQIVIGADGKHSRIAQLVQAPLYREVSSLTCWYISYWSNFATEGLEMHWRPHRVIFSMETNDGLVMNAVGWRHDDFHQFRSDIEGNFLATMKQMPDLAERLPDARRETPFYGMADVPNFFRKPYGPGWALVGDAGHHKDPTPAFGISDAFCDAELLTDALDAGFSGQQTMQDALAGYEQKRNERAIPDHEFTCQRALLENWDDPQSLQLRAALRDNPADAGQFFGVVVRAIPPQTFFAPDNIGRIMAMAQPAS
jgi:flavin-dependent dehydrogenase